MPRAQAQENRALNEVIGLVLLGVGTLLFVSLVCYKPEQVPAWFPLSQKASGTHSHSLNFMGDVGAIVASCSYFFLGAASYLVAAILLGYGGAKLLTANFSIRKRLPWIALFILSSACLFELQHWWLKDWAHRMNTVNATHAGAGGFIGYWIGQRFFAAHLFGPGSLIILGCIYLISLILMTGIHPILLLRKLIALPGIWLAQSRARRIARANERERLEIEEKKLARETQKLEKKLKKQGVFPEPAADPEKIIPALDESLESRPAPQIIDTAAPQPKAKPSKDKPDKLAPKEPVHFDDYKMPELELLDEIDLASRQAADPEELRAIQTMIIETLEQFGISVAPGDITKGPTITRYEVYPAKGVRVDKITSLERDLARATRAERINILAPIPGKDTVGIEIANTRKVKVTLRELLESEDWLNSKAK
ncbi:MAG: DNA translocase FtsK 4TM domain-containing protein, partial [Verrucomicrobiota bacterium]